MVGETAQISTGASPARWLDAVADPVRLGILRSLAEVAEATAADLALWGQASSQTVRRHLEALVCGGIIDEHPARSDGETPGRPATRFSLSNEVRASVKSVLEPYAYECDPALAAATFSSTSAIASRGPMNGARAK